MLCVQNCEPYYYHQAFVERFITITITSTTTITIHKTSSPSHHEPIQHHQAIAERLITTTISNTITINIHHNLHSLIMSQLSITKPSLNV